jgi:hypothetical protein
VLFSALKARAFYQLAKFMECVDLCDRILQDVSSVRGNENERIKRFKHSATLYVNFDYLKSIVCSLKSLALHGLGKSQEALGISKQLSSESDDLLYNTVLMLWSKGEKVHASSLWMNHRSIPWNESPKFYEDLLKSFQSRPT